MIPELIMTLNCLPESNNGKVNRKELPRRAKETSGVNSVVSSVYVPPPNEIEVILCEEFYNVLSIDTVSTNDNILNLWGYSLMAMKLTVRIGRRLDASMSVKNMFYFPTFGAFAVAIQRVSILYNPIP